MRGNQLFVGFLSLFVVTLVTSFTAPIASADVRSNDFSSDPLWTGAGNTTNGNTYGYSAATNQAGGVTGEVGGTFARTVTENYYADTNAISYSFARTVNASGKFDTLNTGTFTSAVEIGYRSVSLSDGSFLGFRVADSDATQVRLGAWAVNAGGTGIGSSLSLLPNNGNYSFSFSYNPTGGLNSNGQISLIVTGASITTITKTLDLDPIRAGGANLDAFGIGAGPVVGGNSAATAQVFLDDVTYAVPEPASAGILLALSGAMVLRRRIAQ